MNPYNFALLFFSFCTFFVSLLIWLKRQDVIGKMYFLFSFFVSMWGAFASFIYNQQASYAQALLAARIADMFAIFIPVTWVHFVLVLTKQKPKSFFLFSLYLFGLFIACFGLTDLFIPKLKAASGLIYYMHPGPIYHLFTIFYFTFVIYGFILLGYQVKKTKGEEKRQLIGLFIATFFGFLGGSLTFFPIYDMFITIPQYNIFLMPLYPFVIAYLMIRHRLFDAEEIAQAFQREKLAAIGLIAASVNHEIRNPLYAARSVLESYQESLSDGDSKKEPKEVTAKALNQIDRALEVITKLNRFAKPSNDSTNSNQQASIPEALQTVLDLVSYEFQLDKIKINNQIPKDIPFIQADQRQLEEILFNLIVNACHAMEQGGALAISASHPERSEGSKVQIVIQDTGTGISLEQTKHLFEPFHTTKGDKGTGLGLYITKQLVERNGGKIFVSSKPNQGTSFVLEFKVLQD